MDEAARPGGWIPFDPATGDWRAAPDAAVVPPEAPRKGVGPLLWTILLGLDMGLLAVSLLFTAASLLGGKGGGDLAGLTPAQLRIALWAQAAFNLIALGLLPLAWGMGTRRQPWRGMVRYFHLDRPLLGVLQGVGWAVVVLLGLVAIGYLLQLVGYQPGNPQADAILAAVTPALAVALALSAGIGEEVFFRGLLQRWVGVWGQAAIFGLFHLGYGTPLQVVVPFLLGLLLGFLVRRGASLWVAITAHFLFDLVQLTSPFWLPPGLR